MRILVWGLVGASLALGAMPAQAQRAPDRVRLEQLIAAAKAADVNADPKGFHAAQLAAHEEAKRIYPAAHAEVAARAASLATGEAALGNYDKAMALLDTALPVLAAAGAKYRHSHLDGRSVRGFVLNYRGEHAKALEEFAAVVAELRANEADKPSELFATALSNLAASEFEAGRLESALALNAEATAMGEKLTPVPNDIAVWYANRVVYLYNGGRTEDAIAAARNGLARSEKVLAPDHPSLANMLANLGSLLVRQGRPNDALPILRRAFELIEKASGAPTQNSAAIRVGFGQALMAAGRHEDAAAFLEAAMPILDAQLGAESDRALLARESRGLALSKLGRHAEALTAQRAVVATRDKRLPAAHRDRMFGRVNLARIAIGAGELEQARVALAEGVALRAAAVPPSHPDLLAERAMLLMVRSRAAPAGAAQLAGEGRALLAALVENANYRAEDVLTQRERDAFGYVAEVLIRAGDVEGAFEAQQYAARTSVDDAVAAAAAQRAVAADPALAEKLGARRKLAAARQALFAQVQAQLQRPAEGFDLAGVVAKIADATEQLRLADAALGPDAAALRRFRPSPAARVQAGLARGEAFLMVSQFDDRAGVTLLTRDGRTQYLLAGDTRGLAERVTAIRALLDPAEAAEAFDRRGAAALYATVVDKRAGALLRGKTRLLVAANGALSAMPFGALVDERGSYLIDRMAVVRLPGAPLPRPAASGERLSALVAMGDVKTAPTGFTQVAMRSGSDARKISDLPALPMAGPELAAIARALGVAQPVVLTGGAATEEALRRLKVPEGAVLAFATHGLVSGELEGLREPALLLSPSGADDGLLTASEISLMDLPALWVILSACNTAAGAGPDAPGLSGLAQAFILAGGRNILATHWPVRDDVARAISVGTLQAAARGAEPSAALQGAIRSVRRDRRIEGAAHPALWAAFELVGN